MFDPITRRFTKLLSLILCFLLCFEQSSMAQIAPVLDISGKLAALHQSLTAEKFRPLHLRYLQYDPARNNFRLLIDKGSFVSSSLRGAAAGGDEAILRDETKKLMSYFFIGLSLPNESFWVNLRPDSPQDIIDPYLAQTDVGKILLESDLQLKKDTAKSTSPETPEGREYWNKLYQKAEELFGSQNITIPTLTRPWIVPDEIIIRETTDSAYVYKATLKVMLESDYLSSQPSAINYQQYQFKDEKEKQLNDYSSQLIRETIIPKLTKEINTAKRYAPLRQVYYSLILASWFKARHSNSVSLRGAAAGGDEAISKLINSRDLTNLTSATPCSVDTYFNAYKENFAKGEYNLQESVQTPFGQVIRSYFSGGITQIAPSIPAIGAPSATVGPAGTKVTIGPAVNRPGWFTGLRGKLLPIIAATLVNGAIAVQEARSGEPAPNDKQGSGQVEQGNKEADKYIKQLGDSNANVRGYAAMALVETKDPRAVGYLIGLAANDKDYLVSASAFRSLLKLEDPKAIDILFRALDDNDPRIRKLAMTVLTEVGNPHDPRSLVVLENRLRRAKPFSEAFRNIANAIGDFLDKKWYSVEVSGIASSDLHMLENIFMQEGLRFSTYKLAAYKIRQIDKDNPGSIKPGSLASVVLALPGKIASHPLAHYQMYLSRAFQEKTKNLQDGARYSVGLASYRFLNRYNLELNEDNIAKAVGLILESREISAKRPIFGNGIKVINIVHREDIFSLSELKDLEGDAGASPIGNYKGKDSKQDALSGISKTSPDEVLTILFNGHGGPEHLWLIAGMVGSERSNSLTDPKGISYQELGDALLKRGNDLGNVTVVLKSCYSYNFKVNLMNYLADKGATKLPTVISSANLDSVSYINIFLSKLREIRGYRYGPITIQDVLAAEELALEKDDFGISIFLGEGLVQKYFKNIPETKLKPKKTTPAQGQPALPGQGPAQREKNQPPSIPDGVLEIGFNDLFSREEDAQVAETNAFDVEDHAAEGDVSREDVEKIAEMADAVVAQAQPLPPEIIGKLESVFGPGRTGDAQVVVIPQALMLARDNRPINGPVRLGNRIFVGDGYLAQHNNDLGEIIADLGHEAMAQWIAERRPDLNEDAHELAKELGQVIRLGQEAGPRAQVQQAGAAKAAESITLGLDQEYEFLWDFRQEKPTEININETRVILEDKGSTIFVTKIGKSKEVSGRGWTQIYHGIIVSLDTGLFMFKMSRRGPTRLGSMYVKICNINCPSLKIIDNKNNGSIVSVNFTEGLVIEWLGDSQENQIEGILRKKTAELQRQTNGSKHLSTKDIEKEIFADLIASLQSPAGRNLVATLTDSFGFSSARAEEILNIILKGKLDDKDSGISPQERKQVYEAIFTKAKMWKLPGQSDLVDFGQLLIYLKHKYFGALADNKVISGIRFSQDKDEFEKLVKEESSRLTGIHYHAGEKTVGINIQHKRHDGAIDESVVIINLGCNLSFGELLGAVIHEEGHVVSHQIDGHTTQSNVDDLSPLTDEGVAEDFQLFCTEEISRIYSGGQGLSELCKSTILRALFDKNEYYAIGLICTRLIRENSPEGIRTFYSVKNKDHSVFFNAVIEAATGQANSAADAVVVAVQGQQAAGGIAPSDPLGDNPRPGTTGGSDSRPGAGLAGAEDHAAEGDVSREDAENIAEVAGAVGAQAQPLPPEIIGKLESVFGPGRTGDPQVVVIPQALMLTRDNRPINGPVRLGNRIFVGDGYLAQHNNDLGEIIADLGHEAMAQWIAERRPDLNEDAHELAKELGQVIRLGEEAKKSAAAPMVSPTEAVARDEVRNILLPIEQSLSEVSLGGENGHLSIVIPKHLQDKADHRLDAKLHEIRQKDGVLAAEIFLGVIIVIYDSAYKIPEGANFLREEHRHNEGVFDYLDGIIYLDRSNFWDFLSEQYNPSWMQKILLHELGHYYVYMLDSTNKEVPALRDARYRSKGDNFYALAYLDEMHSLFLERTMLLGHDESERAYKAFQDIGSTIATTALSAPMKHWEAVPGQEGDVRELFGLLKKLIALSDRARLDNVNKDAIQELILKCSFALANSKTLPAAIETIKKEITNVSIPNFPDSAGSRVDKFPPASSSPSEAAPPANEREISRGTAPQGTQAPKFPGGIDFRFLPIVTQAVNNLRRGTPFALNPNRQRVSPSDLVEEWWQIEKLVTAGIAPSSERIKEYIQAASSQGSLDIDKVVSCISDILRQEEELCCSTEPALRDILVVLEAGRSSEELKEVFVGKI